MATTNFKIFDENKQNIQDDATYIADPSRLSGVSTGIASPTLHNKLFYQTSIMAAALAQIVSNRGYNASDAVFNDLVSAINSALADPNNIKLPASYVQANSLKISNNESDANNDVNISAGKCRDDSDSIDIVLSAMTKRLDAAFGEGTNQGGLNTGSKINSTWYDVYAISKSDGTSDVMFSTYTNRETLPSGFLYKKYIGSIKTDGSGNILGFYQKNNLFIWKSRPVDRSVSVAANTNRNLLTISAPLGHETLALLSGWVNWSGTSYLNIQNPNETDIAAGQNNCIDAGNGSYSCYNIPVLTNTSSQVAYRVDNTSTGFGVVCKGYINLEI